MHRNLSKLVFLSSLAVINAMSVGCTINNLRSDCEGSSCLGGGPSVGGGQATGGATGGTSASVGSSSTAGAQPTGGAQSLGGTSGAVTRTTTTGGLGPTGGSSSTTNARTGGTTAMTSTRTGGTTAVTSTQTGGTTSGVTTMRAGGTSAVGGSSSTALKDSDGDGVADGDDICPSNPAISHPGNWSFSVVFTPAAQTYPEYLDGLKSSMLAAAQDWAKRIPVPHNVSLEIEIDIGDIATANGRSADTVASEELGGLMLYQQGTVYEILTGKDPNGSVPDIEITFGIDPLAGADGHYYWADPDPALRNATMPSNAVDTVSTCLHELGHAFGINGWRDWATGALPGDYASYYDYLSSTDGTDFFFEGTDAVASYGKHVPETYGNLAHIGNYGNGHPGEDLDQDLMRGTRTLLAHRYYISDLDVAILADVGMPIPGTDAANALCKGGSTSSEPQVIELGPRPVAVE